MALNFSTSLFQSSNPPPILAWNSNYINNDRQIFLAVVSAVAIAMILILTGTFLLCSNVSIGLSFVASIVLGLCTTIIGSCVLVYVLVVTVQKMCVWLKDFVKLKKFIQSHFPQVISQQKHSSWLSTFLCSSPLDVEFYGKSWLHPLSSSRVVLSIASIIIGISLVILSVVASILWCSLKIRLDLGLGIVGTCFLVAGLSATRFYSLAAQGASYIYLNRYQKCLYDDLYASFIVKKKKIENLNTSLKLNQKLSNQTIALLEEKNKKLEEELHKARQEIASLSRSLKVLPFGSNGSSVWEWSRFFY
ncbi:hypothetical protein [Chlamydia sp. 17-3921]|uniref:hypothetical protein n=1 Tax=Chlamydia sp. 17-3921 TaxID=2675798 RepID=UPI00191AEE39|nr:hypothetical protein [Chlamydia sp. 17-3921]